MYTKRIFVLCEVSREESNVMNLIVFCFVENVDILGVFSYVAISADDVFQLYGDCY